MGHLFVLVLTCTFGGSIFFILRYEFLHTHTHTHTHTHIYIYIYTYIHAHMDTNHMKEIVE